MPNSCGTSTNCIIQGKHYWNRASVLLGDKPLPLSHSFFYMRKSCLGRGCCPWGPLSAAQRGVWLCTWDMWGEMCSNMPWHTSHCQRCPLLGRSAQVWFQWPVCSWFCRQWPQGLRVVLPEEKCWGLPQTETQKEKWSQNNLLFRDYGQVVEHKTNCILSHMHTFLTLRMWSIPSLACPNFLDGAIGDGNMSGKAFIMAMVCFTVNNKTVSFYLQKSVI